jgi:hypothetical protein
MTKQKMRLSSRPPQQKTKDLDSFINAANNPDASGTYAVNQEKPLQDRNDLFPWEENNVRDDLIKIFNLRFSERYFLKLEYLSKLTKTSKHQLCMDILLREIDKKLSQK